MQDTDIGFAAGHDHLSSLQTRKVALYLFVLAQVEEILFESLGALAQVFADLFRQGSLEIDRPLERDHDRDSEMVEQADKIAGIRLDPGTEALVHLRQEKTLEVDDDTAATIGNNAFHRFHVVRAWPYLLWAY